MSAAEIQEIFRKGADFSSMLLAKVPKDTTQLIVTLSWQGDGSINVTVESSSKNYTEDMVPVYQRTFYSSSSRDRSGVLAACQPVSKITVTRCSWGGSTPPLGLQNEFTIDF